jgi:hypothetical protein
LIGLSAPKDSVQQQTKEKKKKKKELCRDAIRGLSITGHQEAETGREQVTETKRYL